MTFHFGSTTSKNHAEDYLKLLPELLYKTLPKASKGAGKNLISIICDDRSDIKNDDLNDYLIPVIIEKNYLLFERIFQCKSTFDTIGLMYADLVGYLAGRIETIENDSQLFEGLAPEPFRRNGKIRKLQSSQELISKIKNLILYTYEE